MALTGDIPICTFPNHCHGSPPDPTREVDGSRAAALRAALEHIEAALRNNWIDSGWTAEKVARAALATDAGREWLEAWREARKAIVQLMEERTRAALGADVALTSVGSAMGEHALRLMDRLTGPGRDGAPSKLKP